MKWDEGGWGRYRLVDSAGKIIGRVERRYDFEYEAFSEDAKLGNYVSLDHAKKAVEVLHAPDTAKQGD